MSLASFKYLLAWLRLCFFRKSSSRPFSTRFSLKDFFLTRGTLGQAFAKGWFGGRRIIRQGVCSWGAVEALERKESWPKRGQRKEVRRGDAFILGKIIQRSSVVAQSHLAHCWSWEPSPGLATLPRLVSHEVLWA